MFVLIEFNIFIEGESTPVNGEEGMTTQSAKTEISLTLTNKFEVPDDDDSDMRALFVRLGRLDYINEPRDKDRFLVMTNKTSELILVYTDGCTYPCGCDCCHYSRNRGYTFQKDPPFSRHVIYKRSS